MTSNALLMQIQADVLGRKVSRAAMRETTAQGAAFAAGLGAGVFSGFEELVALQGQAETWRPNWDDAAREAGLRRWRKAVDRALGWEEER